jgi:Asp/Glu/hydantoin racemase
MSNPGHAKPRIALLHATPVAVAPIKTAFETEWPEAETVNLLDDSLSADRARDGDLTDAMIERFVSFGRYARDIGSDGILVTCSAFGPAIERLAADVAIPVIKPNEAMFAAAVQAGRRVGMLATFGPSVGTMEAEFEDFIRATNMSATIKTILVDGAMNSLRGGDAATHNRLIAERVSDFDAVDVVMLAHFSTSIAADAVRARTKTPILTAPESAVRLMRSLVDKHAAR